MLTQTYRVKKENALINRILMLEDGIITMDITHISIAHSLPVNTSGLSFVK